MGTNQPLLRNQVESFRCDAAVGVAKFKPPEVDIGPSEGEQILWARLGKNCKGNEQPQVWHRCRREQFVSFGNGKSIRRRRWRGTRILGSASIHRFRKANFREARKYVSSLLIVTIAAPVPRRSL
jgi:hypothetical protein